MALRADAGAERAFIVVSAAFYPGWRATVDGRPARVERANHAFTGLVLGLQGDDRGVRLVFASTAEPDRGASGVGGGVAAADYQDVAADRDRAAQAGLAQELQRADHPPGLAALGVEAAADVLAQGEEDRVVIAGELV